MNPHYNHLNEAAFIMGHDTDFYGELMKVYDTPLGEITLSFILLPFSFGVNSRRKEFAPAGANSFL